MQKSGPFGVIWPPRTAEVEEGAADLSPEEIKTTRFVSVQYLPASAAFTGLSAGTVWRTMSVRVASHS